MPPLPLTYTATQRVATQSAEACEAMPPLTRDGLHTTHRVAMPNARRSLAQSLSLTHNARRSLANPQATYGCRKAKPCHPIASVGQKLLIKSIILHQKHQMVFLDNFGKKVQSALFSIHLTGLKTPFLAFTGGSL